LPLTELMAVGVELQELIVMAGMDELQELSSMI
jgi:hypothetical protein